MRSVRLMWLLLCAALLPGFPAVGAEQLSPVVEVEEDVYRYEPADNGAGPLWCFGSTCLVRCGDQLFASGLATLPDAKPLNNCRWLLYRRTSDGWQLVRGDSPDRTREPCPLVVYRDGRVLLSDNPTLVPDPQAYGGPARPQILQFDARQPARDPVVLTPVWQGSPEFSEHSYRSFAADGAAGELILLQNVGYTHAEWTFCDRDGNWLSQGKLMWPIGDEYDQPQPIRICYLHVALLDRAAYVCGVSDIVEPYQKWREYKRKLTGREWDYDFRRLFFTWCPEITKGQFEPWIEIASRDKTCGWVSPCDLWVDAQRDVHLLWNERAIDERLREAFFPEAQQSHALNYAVVRHGAVVQRASLVSSSQQAPGEIAGQGRFHVMPDGQLLVFYYVQGQDAQGRPLSENRVTQRSPDGRWTPHQTVGLRLPFTQFFTATPRAGSPPSDQLDLLGARASQSGTIGYARVAFRAASSE